MNYYLYINDEQAGPFTIEELATHNIYNDTPIWREDFDDWKKASEVLEIQSLIVKTPPAFKKSEPPPMKTGTAKAEVTPPTAPKPQKIKIADKPIMPSKINTKLIGIIVAAVIVIGAIVIAVIYNNQKAEEMEKAQQQAKAQIEQMQREQREQQAELERQKAEQQEKEHKKQEAINDQRYHGHKYITYKINSIGRAGFFGGGDFEISYTITNKSRLFNYTNIEAKVEYLNSKGVVIRTREASDRVKLNANGGQYSSTAKFPFDDQTDRLRIVATKADVFE